LLSISFLETLLTVLHAANALLADGWAQNVTLTIRDGVIASIESGNRMPSNAETVPVLLAGMPNLHSHAFQRGMAGLAEIRGETADTFWTWREVMYRHALTLSPEQIEAIAAQLYVEMLEAGFTRIGEFHYLHNDRDGTPYADVAELSGRICAAAEATGIALTLLPVLYRWSTFGGIAPQPRQRRFILDQDQFGRLVDKASAMIKTLPQGRIGVAPHSLRAVTPNDLHFAARLMPDAPIHIHAAEQVKEVEDCLEWSGQHPVEWLLDHVGLDARWCLIHATHLTDWEAVRLARSGAVAGLCPVTEGNLGDGVFNGPMFLGNGGHFGIGSDSNILIGIGEELRQLEYAQRLRDRQRNVLSKSHQSTGRRLFDAAQKGGSQALGVAGQHIAIGAPADLVALDMDHPALVGRKGDQIIDSWIFASKGAIDKVWVNGRLRVNGGQHHLREAVFKRFSKAIAMLD
jgi:formimidoylglutamate deiminase